MKTTHYDKGVLIGIITTTIAINVYFALPDWWALIVVLITNLIIMSIFNPNIK